MLGSSTLSMPVNRPVAERCYVCTMYSSLHSPCVVLMYLIMCFRSLLHALIFCTVASVHIISEVQVLPGEDLERILQDLVKML